MRAEVLRGLEGLNLGSVLGAGWSPDRYGLCVVDAAIHGADLPFLGTCEGETSVVFVTMVAFLKPAVS